MELYELGMALSVLLLAAVMDLLDDNSSHTGSRACPPCPADPSAPGGSPYRGPTREVARARSASPEPATDALAARPLDRERGAAVLTPVVTSCRTTAGGEQPKPTAAREAHWVRPGRTRQLRHLRAVLHRRRHPLAAIGLLPPKPPGEVMKDEAAGPL
jgi:hypothetical protein